MRRIRQSFLCLILALLLVGNALAAPVSSEWFSEELAQLDAAGLLPDSLKGADLTGTATRREICELLIRFWAGTGHDLPDLPAQSPFWDTNDPAVLQCHSLGFMKGYGDQFGPDDPLSRQQMFSILANVLLVSGVDTTVDMSVLSSCIDGWSAADWALAPAALMLQMNIVQGDGGYLNPETILTREQALAMLWRTWQLIPVSESQIIFGDVTAAPVPDAPMQPTDPESDTEFETGASSAIDSSDSSLGSAYESYEDKYIRIFGAADAPKYQSAAEAEAHMVTITVPVWNFNTEHIKVQTSRTFQVHEAIADTVMAIFVEIFNGPEQFPIYSIGGYSWRGDGTSEHNWGIALDINPNENYYVYHGVPTVGSY